MKANAHILYDMSSLVVVPRSWNNSSIQIASKIVTTNEATTTGVHLKNDFILLRISNPISLQNGAYFNCFNLNSFNV